MEKESISPLKSISPLVAGVLIGAIMIVYSLALYTLGMQQNKGLGWLGYLIYVVAIIILVIMYGKSKNDHVTFGNLFAYGFKTTAITTLLVFIFLVVVLVAMPDFKAKTLEVMRKNMEDQPKITDEQIDQGMAMMTKNFTLIMLGGAVFMYTLFGVCASLIGGAIAKKKPYNPLEQPV
jgi:hypothetical protein